MNLSDKKLRVFRLTDYQTDLLIESVKMTKRLGHDRLPDWSKKEFNLMFEEVVTPYDGIKIAGGKKWILHLKTFLWLQHY